jgi:hypothetical protein
MNSWNLILQKIETHVSVILKFKVENDGSRKYIIIVKNNTSQLTKRLRLSQIEELFSFY